MLTWKYPSTHWSQFSPVTNCLHWQVPEFSPQWPVLSLLPSGRHLQGLQVGKFQCRERQVWHCSPATPGLQGHCPSWSH